MIKKLYWKIFSVFLLILVALGSIFIFITAKTVVAYNEEASQHLNAGVAKQIASDTHSFIDGAVNKPVVEKLFHNAMILNPGAEIYLLDPQGRILSYSAPDSVVKRKTVSLEPIKKFIAAGGNIFIEGDNPRHTNTKKVFSGAAVYNEGELKGYIYVILGGDKYQSITSVMFNSYIARIALLGMLFTIIAALLVGSAAFSFITRDLKSITAHVEQFEQGNWKERIAFHPGSELGQLAATFNKMASTIEANIENIKSIEQSRMELIANVSHDLRTPLAVIKGYAETLQLKKNVLPDTEKEQYISILVKSSTNLQKLVEELFELSKLEAKTVVPEFETFSLSELLLDNISRYQIIANEKFISIQSHIPVEMPMVYADIALTDRVLQNLIGNAIKFTPPHGRITAGLALMDTSIRVNIKDTGIGIPGAKLNGIFERYYHSDYKGADRSGIGLGLAIVRKILEIQGSQIYVTSIVGEGSNFFFELPLKLPFDNLTDMDMKKRDLPDNVKC
ncbi:MAG: HAMP domain-containing sensor histidine kinase [Bacteroidota bacterium]